MCSAYIDELKENLFERNLKQQIESVISEWRKKQQEASSFFIIKISN